MHMQVSVENVQGLERRLKVCVPVETVNKVVEECFQKAAKTVKMDGFRPGKVPRRMLEERFGYSIRHHEAAPQLIQDTLWDAFKQVDIEPIGRPMIEGSITLETSQPLNYSVLFDVLPEIELKDLNGKEVEQLVSEVTDADLDKAIEQMRREQAKEIEITTPAENNDIMTLSYTVEVDGELVDLEKAENLTVSLDGNSKLLVPALEEKLIGLSAGDEKVIEATFPEDYPAVSVAGKAAKFYVKIHAVKRLELPTLDDEFIKKFDGAANLEEFRKNIRSSMNYYLKNSLANINKINLFDALAVENDIELPKSMVQREIEEMGKGFLRSIFRQQDISDTELQKHLPLLSKFYKKQAEHRIRLSLLIEEFLKKNPQDITDEMMNNMLEERSALYQDPKAWLEEYTSVPANKDQIRHILLELAIAEKLRESATIKAVELDYFAVLEKEKEIQNRGFGMDMDEEEGDDGEGEGHHVHDENCQHHHHHDHDGETHHHD